MGSVYHSLSLLPGVWQICDQTGLGLSLKLLWSQSGVSSEKQGVTRQRGDLGHIFCLVGCFFSCNTLLDLLALLWIFLEIDFGVFVSRCDWGKK